MAEGLTIGKLIMKTLDPRRHPPTRPADIGGIRTEKP